MKKFEEVPHLRSMFRQYGNDEQGKIFLVESIRGAAIKYLQNPDGEKSKQWAENLERYCAMAIEKNAVSDQLQGWILDAYAGLDADNLNREQFDAILSAEVEKQTSALKNKNRELIGEIRKAKKPH